MNNTPLEFRNRRGDIYYVKSKLTKKGNTTYYTTKKKDEKCLNSLPGDYEVFEQPDTSMMHIRRKKENAFGAEEVGFVEAALKKNEEVADFKLDMAGNLMKIYVIATEDVERMSEMWRDRVISEHRLRSLIQASTKFEERMRVIKDKDGGYEFQRYCFRGSIDDWIGIDGGDDLKHLAEDNIRHLGRESYYEL